MFVKVGEYEKWPFSVDGVALFNGGHNGGEVVVARISEADLAKAVQE